MHEGGEKYIQKILVGIFQGKFCFRGLDQFVYIISLRIKEFFFFIFRTENLGGS